MLRDLLKLNVLVHGSTGIAASNIEGFTVHSLQNLNSYFEAIRGSQKTEYAEFIKDVDFIIIDEISMLSTHDIIKLEQQLKNHASKERRALPWGGFPMLLVGDFCQLLLGPGSHGNDFDLATSSPDERNWQLQTEIDSVKNAHWFVLTTCHR